MRIHFRARFWTRLPFWQISLPFEPRMRIVNSSWCNLIIEEECCFVAPKIISPSSCLKPCQLIVSSESFQGCLPVAYFCQPWARVYDSLTTLKTPMIAMLLSIVRWPLLDHYLHGVYFAHHSLDSPCASHVLLAIKEHIVCGAISHCFSRAQKLSL
jgi:hypothetical protein